MLLKLKIKVTKKTTMALKNLSFQNTAKQLLRNSVNLILLTVILTITQLANTIEKNPAPVRDSLFPYGHHVGHVITTTKATHAAITSGVSANPDTNPTATFAHSYTDLGLGAGAGLSVGFGTGYFVSKGNPRTALLLTATSLAATLGAGAFLDSYHQEVKHLRAGFKEISAIKQAQDTQQQLLVTARHDVGTSKALIETTFGVTAATSQRLKDLAEQQALNKLEVSKLDTSVKTTHAQVSDTLAKTQAGLVQKIITQDNTLTDAQKTSDSWLARIFGPRTSTTETDTKETSALNSYSERWD